MSSKEGDNSVVVRERVDGSSRIVCLTMTLPTQMMSKDQSASMYEYGLFGNST